MNHSNASRRKFIKQNTLASLGILSLGSTITACAVSKEASRSSDILDPGLRTISDLNLKQLRETYRKALFDRFIPNMDSLVIDHELGGFMCGTNNKTRELVSTNKRAWFEGRGIWVYSFLYNNLDKNPRYLEIARKSKDFILKNLPSDDSFFSTAFTKEGKPIKDPEKNIYGGLFSPEGDIYGNLFIAEGLAEYAKATGERKYYDLAKEIIFKAVRRYDSPDYVYLYGGTMPVVKAPRINGHWMILLSVTTQMLKQGPDAQIQALADRCVDCILNKHMNPNFHLINEVLNHDFSLPNNEWAQYAYVGHGCETTAFLLNYAVLRKDAALFKRSAEAFKRHVAAAKDPIYGGYYNSLNNVDTNMRTLGKVRWLQDEVRNGAITIAEHTGDPWALNCFAETEKYVQEKFLHPEYAFIVDNGDRKMEQPSILRAENYHHPRQLMVALLAIDRMIANKEKPSGLFG
jgi:N-acylglucosamine 2-epimerase